MQNKTSDPVVLYIASQAERFFREPKVFFFGSRAKKTHAERSDYDFAIDTNGADHSDWSRFVVDVDETAPTLLKIDLIKLDNGISAELRNEILNTGIRIV